MSVFVDTGVFYAFQNERAQHHDAAANALSSVFAGRFGAPFTSDYVYDESVTLVRARTGSYDEAKTVGDRIRGVDPYPDAITMLYVSEGLFQRTLETFERYDDHSLSFTDASTIALVDHHDIDAALSFDDDFDGLVERLDPADC